MPDSIAKKVGSDYGDPKPKILKIDISTTDDKTHEHMYLITLQGNFSKGSLKASQLLFSALDDGSKIWAIVAKNNGNVEVWQDNELPKQ